MTQQHVDVVLVECAVPGEELVEGEALRAVVVLLDEAVGRSLVAVVHIHIAHAKLVLIVQAEVGAQLQALQPASRLAVGAQHHTSVQDGNVALAECLVVDQATQRVVVGVGTGTSVLTVVKLRLTVLVEHVVTLKVLDVEREQRRNEL